jgi:branched-chain amino acid transport system substrate-binding protein
MLIAGETAQKAGGDKGKVREALMAGSWTTIVGPVDFQDFEGFQNQNQIVMPVIQYQGGKSVTIFPPKMAKAKAVYPFPGWK